MAREPEALGGIAKGLTDREIAAVQDDRPKTVNYHVNNILGKLPAIDRPLEKLG